ncbi:YppE family protein [Alkalihalobacillus trypoxylicola]|uniref:DUF1798 domain-containing protein n=1 Tax=Alkalihalobacillus trypoxylicola TaxID=519424 RepID=A0A162EHJ2_9BACI|nr:YppE family protein [Alkalihalobacillus trypoxylicola]KYG32902.1 hypothetical protein AZF04_18265 [Alkalihalobacillus trypoxylicola]
MTDEQLKTLRQINQALLEKNQFAKEFFLDIKEKENYEPDFFGTVKPFTDEVTQLSMEWHELATIMVAEKKPKQLFSQQLEQTVDNFETVAIKSFYPKTSRKNQLETFKSVEYVLRQLDDVLNTSGSNH